MQDANTDTLILGEEAFTLLDIIRKAAAYLGVVYHEGASKAYSDPIVNYPLDSETLRFLETQDFEVNRRTGGVLTVSGQKDYWNYRLNPDGDRPASELVMGLAVGFGVSRRERGVVLLPLAHGSFLSPVAESPDNLKMFRAMVKLHTDTPDIVQRLAKSDGNLVVSWTELGIPGIQRMVDLFFEFCSGNEEVRRLAQRQHNLFQPHPYNEYRQPGEEIYIVEPAQPRLMRRWDAQLKDFRAKLQVAS